MPQSSKRFEQGYTALLMGVGFMFVLTAVMMHTMAKDQEEPQPLILVRNIEIVLAGGCLLVAVLRVFSSKAAAPATVAMSWILAVGFPFGTAVFLWWFLRVRKREDPALGDTSE